MSIDASVWRGDRCRHFEVDGKPHFPKGLHMRTRPDEVKDTLLNVHKVATLRLHFADQEMWHAYVAHHMTRFTTCVTYTRSYRTCLRAERSECDIVELAV